MDHRRWTNAVSLTLLESIWRVAFPPCGGIKGGFRGLPLHT